MASDKPLIKQKNFKRVHDLLHLLWSKAVGTEEYDKKQWSELDTAILRMANDGPDGENNER